MPPKNKKGRNGFYYFMQEMRQDELDQGRHRSMEEMQTLASPGWQALTPDEKEYYNNKAKQEKRKGATDDERKFTSLGVSFATVEANTREVEEQLKVMKATMKKIVSSSPEALTRNTFYVCHVNHYFKYDIDCYQPAEIALAEFSLEKGLTDTLHFILHPGNIPIGMKADAQIWAEKTHGIRLTDRQGEEELVRERNYVHVYSAVVNFLKKDAGVNHGAMVLPIIYTMPDSINNNTNLTAVKYCMRFLSKCAHEDRDLFRIYPLPELFFLLRQKYKFDDAPTVAVMESEIEKDQFSYVSDLGCEFHEARDLSLHCSLSMVKRWIFTVCDHICAHAGVEMVPGHHVPHKADFTWTTVHSTNKKLNPSASAGYIDPPPRDPPRFFDPTQLQLTGPSLVTNAHPNGGDLIRRGFMKRGLSPDVVATLCNSLSQTTLKQYASSYNLWELRIREKEKVEEEISKAQSLPPPQRAVFREGPLPPKLEQLSDKDFPPIGGIGGGRGMLFNKIRPGLWPISGRGKQAK